MDVGAVAACVGPDVPAAARSARAVPLGVDGRGQNAEREDGEEKTGEADTPSPNFRMR